MANKGADPLAKADFHGDCIIDMDANAFVKLIALSVSSRRIGFFEPNTLKRSPLKIDTLVTVHSLRFSPREPTLPGDVRTDRFGSGIPKVANW